MTRADTIIRNANIITMDEAAPHAEAIALAGGSILAVGHETDVMNLAGPGTRVIDARRATVMPGFIESHMHIFSGSASLTRLDLTGVAGKDALRKAIVDWAARHPGDGIIFANQASYTLFGDQPAGRQLLDEVCPHRPFAMMSPDFHTAWANTAALKSAGILNGRVCITGSQIAMGDDGLATGELLEADAFIDVVALTPTQGRESLGITTARDPHPAATPEQRAADTATLKRGLDYCASLGITTIHNMDGTVYQCELLHELERNGGLSCRIAVPFHYKNDKQLSDLEEAEHMRRTWSSDSLWCGHVKLFMDGVLDSGTAFVLGGYPDDPAHDGDPLFTQAEFIEIATEVDRRGFQIAVHAIGDAAVRRTLDGYEAAQNANGKRDARHRIEHIEIIDGADIPRLAQLGVIASMQPLHPPGCGFPVEPTASKIGAAKLPRAFAWNTLRQAGANMCFASDWPVSPVDPLLSLKSATTRKKLAPEHPDQRQTLYQAIHGYTAGGAYAEFSEHRKGRLKPGYMADVVMLDGDIEKVAPDDITSLKVAMTICGGEVTYEA
ncbi:MAG: amidohydrolase [Anderseniella sp.]|jgi:predicted amidohydrolase YtcJ|nr:amidohydrolase [Anderseniella sp.]